MRRWKLSHFTLCTAIAMASCSANSSTAPPLSRPAWQREAHSYQVLLRFGSEPRRRSRGRVPGGLLNMGGTFYGVTANGGGVNDGTVFSMSPAGEDKVLYRFRGGSDAEHPQAALIDVGGTLYGTSYSGGGGCFLYDFGCGTVFRTTTAGKEEVLHRFTYGCESRSCADGANPNASLIDVKGTLYGTTFNGGRGNSTSYPCCGTVYSISPGGKYKVLYRFCGSSNCADGSSPVAGLIDVNGTLYGATVGGGKYDAGTVFSIGTSGKENVLYSFSGGSDGLLPYGALIDVNGTLYGTTLLGGAGKCHINAAHGCGIVYSVSLSGTEKVLYRFAGGSDGAFPAGGLTNVNGALYGTTPRGGEGDCKKTGSSPSGCGTIYEVTTAGSESILHSFRSGTDGARPSASLTNVNGTLYGTTTDGGLESCRDDACGTVFALTPK